MSDEHFQETVVDLIGILRNTGVNELFQFPLKAQTVDIHLHVIGDLTGQKARPLIASTLVFFRFNIRVEAEAFASFMQETERKSFQAEIVILISASRLHGTALLPVETLIFPLHLFQRCICHIITLSACSV